MSSPEEATALLSDCGATGPLEVEVEDGRRWESVRLVFPQPFLVLGRDDQVDLRLDDEAVSRRHAYLQVVAGRVFVFDLASRTGLSWEGRTAGRGWLGRGQALRVGPFTVRVVGGLPDLSEGAPYDPLMARPPGEDPLPAVVLEGAGPDGRPVVWRMDRTLALVGQARACKLRVAEGDVSRFSSGLLRTAAGLWVIDLLGRPGARVNGEAVRYALLRDGDQLQVGDVTVRVGYGSAPVANPPAAGTGVVLPGAAGAARRQPRWPLPPVAAPRNSLVALPPDPPGGDDAVAAQLMPLVGQFAAMQQQMFDQFAQMMLMMGQMFSDLQRDQLGLIRDELRRVQQLSEELRELQTELASHEVAAPRPGRAGARPEVVPLPSPVPREVAALAVPAAPAAVPPPKAPAVTSAGKGGAAERPRPPGKAGGARDLDIHTQLSERIQQLQQERESRWQKLLGSLFGKAPADTPAASAGGRPAGDA